jgi:hypothetical protein
MQRKFSRTDAAEADRKRAQEEAQRENEARRQEQIEYRRHLCTSL